MGRKIVLKKGRNVVKEPGESSEEAPLSDSAPHISLSDDDGSPLASPKLSRTKTSKKSKIKGKHPAKPAHRKLVQRHPDPNLLFLLAFQNLP